MNEIRKKKIESAISQIIMRMIMHGEIKDPRVNWDINISRVKVSGDLSLVKVYISSFKGGKSLAKACDGLESAAGIIRKGIGKALQLKNTPKPLFMIDESLKEEFILGEKIKAAMKEIEKQTDSETDERNRPY